ncbi:MAG TPA: Ig-like domain-containing protein, partial [Pyrinomonadaceae bacterium]|nr:Ig-like domain-containing protein [Pyrinomonadaceae bacterium]
MSVSALLAVASLVWATRQQASAPTPSAFPSHSAAKLSAPDTGPITPQASAITVNSLSDVANGGDGLCTLREAIGSANNNTASGGAAGECAAGSSSGSDVINFTVTGTINLAGVLPDIASAMTIIGPGSGQLTIKRSSGGLYRIFNIASGVTSGLSGMTVRDGKTDNASTTNSGAGIRNLGTLTINDVTVTSNQTGLSSASQKEDGGGVANQGTLTMTNCLVTGNSTGNGPPGGDGGGIANSGTLTITDCVVTANFTGAGAFTNNPGGNGGGISNSGQMTINRTTISNNFTGEGGFEGDGGKGGAIYSTGPLSLLNSTVSGNSTGTAQNGRQGQGAIYIGANSMTIVGSTISGNTNISGAIANRGQLVAINSTVSGNQATAGIEDLETNASMRGTNLTVVGNQGLGLTGFNLAIRNSIVAKNSADCGGAGSVASQGHNLIGFCLNAGFTNGVNGDQIGTAASPLDPHVGPLANNGGPTMTHALLSNSTALDAGDDCVTQAAHCSDANISQLLTDQRGFTRIADGPDVDTTATVDIGALETQGGLADLPDTTTNEDTQVLADFDAGDSNTITSVTATSDNPTLVPNDSAHLSVALQGNTEVVTINPAANLSGTANITVTVNRTGPSTDSKTFLLTVNPVNDLPSFTAGANQTVNEDAGAQTFVNWATAISPGPADESGQVLTFQVTGNTNAALFSAAPAISSSGTLTFTPAANASGSATITLNLKDNGGTGNGGVDTSAAQTFTIAVNPVNDAPSFTKGADQTINEDGGSQTVTNWATNISRGPTDESGQTLTFTATNDNNALFSAQPAINSTGTLTYTPAANANGTATVTVTLKDNGGTANGGLDTSAPQTFTITVNSINDVPSFTKGPNQTVNEDAAAQTVNNWATSISAGAANESGQVLTFQVTGNTNAALFSAGPAISSTGTLTYTPAANGNGSATLTISLKDDGGTANGGVDTSVSQTFTITVNSVNDVPSFTKGADQTVNNNAGAQTVSNWATAISSGPANESGQTLTFQITGNTNASLFSAGPAISSAGTLSYTPAANGGGTATITVNLRDNGGTANGGVDTSAAQ